MSQPTATIDLDMLAYDIADMLDRNEYDIDVADCHIRPALPAFLAAIRANAAGSGDEPGTDAATWTAAEAEASDEPPANRTPRKGRRPRATYYEWRRSQLVNIGATARDEHYWQCPYTGCKVWAGPYPDPVAAKGDGFQHVYTDHADQYFRRGRR